MLAYLLSIPTAVALFTRAWIEIVRHLTVYGRYVVALFTRAWIEMTDNVNVTSIRYGRPLHEGVD